MTDIQIALAVFAILFAGWIAISVYLLTTRE